jgi:hypothetical protein
MNQTPPQQKWSFPATWEWASRLAGPTHEGRIKFACSEAEYNGRNSHEYLKNRSCQELLPLFYSSSEPRTSSRIH